MMRELAGILLLVTTTTSSAGEYCDNLPYECPGPLCDAAKRMCLAEMEKEKAHQQYVDTDKAAASANVSATKEGELHGEPNVTWQAERESKSQIGSRKIAKPKKAAKSQ